MAVKAKFIYELKVSLRDITPQIWRRVLVPGDFTLGDLHEVVGTAMGWDFGHLHSFTINGAEYCPMEAFIDDFSDADQLDEDRYTLDKLKLVEKQRFTYLYDFGDSWEHTILVSKIIPAKDDSVKDLKLPMCLSGKRACPPEDCGGVWGYDNLLEAMSNPEKFKESDYFGWIENYDPEKFDINLVNTIL